MSTITRIEITHHQLPLDPPPDRFVAELAGAGATIVSLNPLRETLEDLFVEQVARSGERT